MKRLFGAVLFLFVLSGCFAAEEAENSTVFLRPFLAHSGLAMKLGQYDLRVTALLNRGEMGTREDLGIHYETGLIFDRLSMHIRTDGIVNEDFLEYMWQYNILQDAAMNNGFAVLAGFAIPMGINTVRTDYRGVLGLTYRMTWGEVCTWNAGVHKDTAVNMYEYESSFIFKASTRCYPSLEIRGMIMDGEITAYVFPGLKVKVNDNTSVGMGVSGAVTLKRDYDLAALFTFDTSF